jgi:CBS domain containing-hemolysin-like protein
LSNLFSSLFNNKTLSAIEEKFQDELQIVSNEDNDDNDELYEMMLNVLRLRKTEAKEIMTPRVDLHGVSINATVQEAAAIVVSSGESRVPVFDEKHENIVGIVHAKALLRVLSQNSDESLESILLSPYFVPEMKSVDELLVEMRQNKVHSAVIIDEYGSVCGIVKLDDIIERIVGSIQDEFNKRTEDLIRISDSEFIANGRISITHLSEMTGIEISTLDVDTLGGLIFTLLGRVPKDRESIEYGNYLFTIETISGRKIKKVRIVKKENDYEKTED